MKKQSFGKTSLLCQNRIIPCHYGSDSDSSFVYVLASASSALKNYRENRENGEERDTPRKIFPSARFEELKIRESTYKPNGPKKKNFWPDKQGRYWWRLTLEDGRVNEDYYWMQDKIRGYPDKADSDRYWFSVYHAPSGIKIEGFSTWADKIKGYPDKDGNYWSYVQYDECGAIERWMKQKDRNYEARIKTERKEEMSATEVTQKFAIAKKEKADAETKKLSRTLLETVNSKDLSTLKQFSTSKETIWSEIDAQGNNVFHLAAKKKSNKTYKLLLKSVPKQTQTILLCQSNVEDETPLHLAARLLSSELVGSTLKSLSKNTEHTLKAYSKRGYLPIHEAAQSGKIETIQILLDAGANIHSVTKTDLTVVQCAEQNGHSILAQTLALMIKSTPSSFSSSSSPSSSSSSNSNSALNVAQSSAIPLLMQALYHYQPQSQEELFVSAGESITVLQQNETGWWKCRNSRGWEGYLPMNYLGAVSSGSSSGQSKSSSQSPESASPNISGNHSSGSHSSGFTAGLNSGAEAAAESTPTRPGPGLGLNSDGTGQVNLLIPFSEIRLGKELGRGGFGAVYKADWQGDTVAVKQLFATKLTDDLKENFLHEAGIMMQLRHDNIVQLYGISLEPYSIIMPFLAKGSLDRLLHSKEPLSFALRYRIALNVARGLGFLHRRNILHRDLKSLNVLLDEHYKAKLSDFGLSKIKLSSSNTYGNAGIAGTLQWIAPELLMDAKEKYTKSCDVYSYGILLWEISSRQVPYQDISNRSLIVMHVIRGNRETIPFDVPRILSQLIAQCWAQEANGRPLMSDVITELTDASITDETPIPSPHASAELSIVMSQSQSQSRSSLGGYAPSSPIAPNALTLLPQGQGGSATGGFFQPSASPMPPSGYMQSLSSPLAANRELPPVSLQPSAPYASSQPSFFQPASGYGTTYSGSPISSDRELPQPSSHSGLTSSETAMNRPASGYGRSEC